MRSDRVRAEADLALQLSKLLSVQIDNAELPVGFRSRQPIRLQHQTYDADVNALIAAIRRMMPVPPIQTSEPTSFELPSTSEPRAFAKQPTAPRTSVFIAHASVDKPRIRPIVELLVNQGFQVWIDKPHELGLPQATENRLRKDRIRHDVDWPEQIRAAVKRSDVVLGFWSKMALESERRQFQYEMYMGLIQGKLQQCRFDNLTEREIGYPWSFNQMANITTYVPGAYHAELDLLMTDFAKKPWWRR